MSIYKKIAEIQQELLKEGFQTKKGFHGKYIPLPIMLPPILKQCFEKELTLYFTTSNEHFMLKLMSWDNNNREEFSARVRLPELSRDEKDEGKKITYLKRYLLMNTFMIIEESVDPDDIPDTASSAPKENKSKSSNKSTKTSFNVEELWEQAKPKAMKEKGLSEKNLTNRSIYAYIARNWKKMGLSQEQKEEMFHYYKNLGEVVA